MRNSPTVLGTRGLPREERFWLWVDRTDTCWLWRGHLQRGYGRFFLGGGRYVLPHRFAYELLVGPIPDGRVLDHLCRVRHCVRPDHLEPVTSRENTMRSPVALGSVNAMKTECPRGHPYDEENTRWYRGFRYCRTCRRLMDARRSKERSDRRQLARVRCLHDGDEDTWDDD